MNLRVSQRGLAQGIALATLGLLGCASIPASAVDISQSARQNLTAASADITSVSSGLALSTADSVKDCYDGTCEIVVSGPTSIPLDSRFRVPGLSVTAVGPRSVEFRAANGALSGQGSAGSRLTFNSIAIQIIKISNGSARLRISPA